MLTTLITDSSLSFTIAAISVVLCPTLCGLMALRISRAYTTLRSSGPGA